MTLNRDKNEHTK